jgi:hypothetical protein
MVKCLDGGGHHMGKKQKLQVILVAISGTHTLCVVSFRFSLSTHALRLFTNVLSIHPPNNSGISQAQGISFPV